MKRMALLFLVTLPVFGLTRTPAPGDRIGILSVSEEYPDGPEHSVATTLRNELRRELRARGFEAFNANRDDERADYFVEIVSSGASDHPVAGIGAGIGAVGVDVSVVVARVAAELRVYDGRTMEVIDRFDLRRKNTAVVPTGVGVGTRSVWAFIALPLVNHAQYRAAARAVARDAAERIARR